MAFSYSPVATPPGELASGASASSSASSSVVEEAPIGEKELKLFFDPPETIEEYKRSRRSMFLPPSNEQELHNYVKQFEEDRKTKCNVTQLVEHFYSNFSDLLQKTVCRATNDALQMQQNLL